MYVNTIACLQSFIIQQNFYCIHRGYLINSKKVNIICKFIVFILILIIIAMNIFEIAKSMKEVFLRIFEMILMIEHTFLIVDGWFKTKAFDWFTAMDEYCGMDEEYGRIMNRNSWRATYIVIILALIDASIFLLIPKMSPAISFGFWAAFAAHNSEQIFYSLLIQGINIRLSRLKHKMPIHAINEYRIILVGTSHLNYEFCIRVSASIYNICICY